MAEVKFNKDDRNQQLIISALVNMIEEGYSARETLQVLEKIKNNVFFALKEFEDELNPIE